VTFPLASQQRMLFVERVLKPGTGTSARKGKSVRKRSSELKGRTVGNGEYIESTCPRSSTLDRLRAGSLAVELDLDRGIEARDLPAVLREGERGRGRVSRDSGVEGSEGDVRVRMVEPRVGDLDLASLRVDDLLEDALRVAKGVAPDRELKSRRRVEVAGGKTATEKIMVSISATTPKAREDKGTMSFVEQ
jgi:hypothetical protein